MNDDLISRSAAIEQLERREKLMTGDKRVGVEHIKAFLQNRPAVDAVEVVRCKDCSHWGTGYGGETENVKVCEYANYMVGANGYCVYGERKMDTEVEE